MSIAGDMIYHEVFKKFVFSLDGDEKEFEAPDNRQKRQQAYDARETNSDFAIQTLLHFLKLLFVVALNILL